MDLHVFPINVFIYLFLLTLFMSNIKKKSLSRPKSRCLPPMFSFRSFMTSSLIFKFLTNPIQVNFCVWWETRVQYHFLPPGNTVLSSSLIKETILFPSCILDILVKKIVNLIHVFLFCF